MTVNDSKMVLETNTDTSCRFEETSDSNLFCTSTPNKLQKACQKCYKKCVEKHHFGMYIEEEPDDLSTLQAALML